MINKISMAGLLLAILFITGSCKKEKTEDNGCISTVPTGQLSFSDPAGPFTFKTSDGGTIVIDLALSVVIMHDDYPGFKIGLWGGSNVNGETKLFAQLESLNAKHIKNRLGSRRTIIFPGGAKITMVSEGEEGSLISISIYDGAESHQINYGCKALVNSSTSLAVAQQFDNAEADGETSKFEISATGLLWSNIYTEDVPGNKVNQIIKLAELFRNDPMLITDYYDDPRIGHT